jgi:DNA-binding transcriptional LysR family regulator
MNSTYILFTFFVSWRDWGSVTKAAQELFISQPAVSAHLRSLEQHYGESLFERTPRGMLLTSTGKAFSVQVNILFAIYEDLPSAVDAVAGVCEAK